MSDRYFVGDVNSNWNNANNWAATSGGAGGAGIPGSGDKAIFDGYSPDCNIDSPPSSIGDLDLQSSFSNLLNTYGFGLTVTGAGTLDGGNIVGSGSDKLTFGTLSVDGATVSTGAFGGDLDINGDLTVASGSLTVIGSGRFDCSGTVSITGGTFTLNSGPAYITSTGAGEGFRQSGGTVTLTSGTLTVNSDFERTAGTLNHNNGTLYMNRVVAADRDLNVNGATLYNVTINFGAYAVDWDSDVTIEGKLTFSGRGIEGSATITCKGDFQTNSTSTVMVTACTLVFDGTGDQEISTNSGTRNILAKIKIDKPSGTLSFVNGLQQRCTNARFEYVQGTLDWSACTLFEFAGNHQYITCTADFTCSAPLVNVTNGAFTFYIQDGNFTVTGEFRISGTGNFSSSGGGEVHAQGTVSLRDSSFGNYPSTGLIRINGTGDQTLEANGGTGRITRLFIDKPSGTLTIEDTIRVGSDASAQPSLEYIQGTVDAGTSTIHIGSGSYDSQRIKTGAMELNNLTVNPSGSYNCIVDGQCIVKGKLLVSSVNDFGFTNGGYIDAYGDVEFDDTSIHSNSDCPVNLRGAETQSLKCNAVDLAGIPFTVNKTGGSVALGENFAPNAFTSSFTVTAGTLDLAGYDLNIAARTLTITDKLKLKGSETITATLVIGAASTVEYYDDAVEVTIDDLTDTFYNLILGAGKTHKVTAGVGNGITVNGNFGNTGTPVNRAILRSTVDGTQWELDLQGTSGMSDGVDVKDSNASAGNRVTALNSEDSGDNDNWFFGIGQGGFGLFRPNSFRYNRGICPKQLG